MLLILLMGAQDSYVVVDTSFLSDLSRRMVWTVPAVKAYSDAGGPPILVPDGVLGEYDRLLREVDDYGVPKSSLTLETQLKELQHSNRQRAYPSHITGEYLLREIFAMWQSFSPKAQRNLNYSVVDERIMEVAVSHAKQGNHVFVASADSDITATLEGYAQQGLPITVWKPGKLERELMEGTGIDLLVTGEVLQKLPGFGWSGAYKYYLKVATGVHFEGDYVADVALDTDRTDFIKIPAQHSGIRWVRVVRGGRQDPEADLRYLRTESRGMENGLLAFFYPQQPGMFRLYEKLPSGDRRGSKLMLRGIKREILGGMSSKPERARMQALFGQEPGEKASLLESAVRDPDMRLTFEARRWARVDEDFLARYSPHTLHTLREFRAHYPIN